MVDQEHAPRQARSAQVVRDDASSSGCHRTREVASDVSGAARRISAASRDENSSSAEPSTTSTSPTPMTTSSRPSTAGSRARSSGHLMVTFDLPSSTRSTVGSRPSTASGIRTSSTLPRNPRDAPGAAPDTATVQPSLFSFGFLGEPAKREWMWDARVNRAAGGSLPPVPSDSHLLF